MIQLDFPQRLHFREASSVVYPKEIFYTIYDIQLWTLANGTIWQAVFVDNGKRWKRIKEEELKQIIDHANNMNKFMESTGEEI